MTAHGLVSGTLFRAPEQRTSKAGKPFVAATLKAKDGETAQWWKVLAFSEAAQADLMRFTDGDALSVQGALKVEEYEKDGHKRISLSVITGHVLGAAPAQKQREKSSPSECPTGANRDFDDAIPY